MEKQEVISSKIIDRKKLPSMLAYWRFRGKKIVFTNGCFDLIHLGHIDYLSRAADQGDILVVGINTDDSVSRLKGPGRPINSEQARARLMASLFYVSAVVLFDEDTPFELIKAIQPDVLVKGSDYKAEEIVGYDIVMQKGGKVITLDFLEGYSTSGIVEKIRKDTDPFTI